MDPVSPVQMIRKVGFCFALQREAARFLEHRGASEIHGFDSSMPFRWFGSTNVDGVEACVIVSGEDSYPPNQWTDGVRAGLADALRTLTSTTIIEKSES